MLLELSLQRFSMQPQPARSLRDVAAGVGQHPLDVLPLGARQRRGGRLLRGLVRGKRSSPGEGGEQLVGIHRLLEVVQRPSVHRLERGGDAAVSGENHDSSAWIFARQRPHQIESGAPRHSKIHHDETRHIGYGIWFLRETVRTSADMGDVVRQTLRDLLPSVAASLAPPDTGSDRDFAAIGASSGDIRAFALDGLTRRLDIIGVPLASL